MSRTTKKYKSKVNPKKPVKPEGYYITKNSISQNREKLKNEKKAN